jgi:hypothetical protein
MAYLLDIIGGKCSWLASIIALVGIAVCISLPQSPAAADDAYYRQLQDATPQPDLTRLPSFYTSDPSYDEFVNEYFQRYLNVDKRGVHLPNVMLGAVNQMWVVEWDWWMLPWIDRGAMGLARQGGDSLDVILSTLLTCAVDKYGYTWGGRPCPDPKNILGSYMETFGWPFAYYNRNYTVTKPTGWEFNDIKDGHRDEWTATDIDLAPGYPDYSLVGKITGPRPEFISPKFDCDAFQIPIVALDVEYKSPTGTDSDKCVNGLRVYWTTDANPRFSEDRAVTVDFCDMPPRDFAADFSPWVSGADARYTLYFPMCVHPEWGRGGRRITRLKIVPTGPGCEGTTVSLNYVRATYDSRLSTTNSTLINAAFKFYMWSGDERFLRTIMPKLRRSMIFMNEHLQGKRDDLLNFDWYVGHDGLGGDQSGHGLIACYWDLLPNGRYDLESSCDYYYALNAMSELERVIKSRRIAVPDVSVIGPDNKTVLHYSETPESLKAYAARVKAKIEKVFWNRETQRFARNIDVNGKQHDYGFLHHNLAASAFGIGTTQQRKSILSWLDGSRIVPGDTSTGADIYHWRFSPRITTRHNADYYFWPWIVDARNDSGEWRWSREFGNQLQDGGAASFTSLFDLMLRTSTGDQAQIDSAFERTKEIRQWFLDVKAAGGEGTEFYRKYYEGHPERGRLQSPMPGGLGLDHEFLSDGSLGTEFLFYAFLGIDTNEDNVLSICPAVPSQLDKIGVTNVFYRGNHLTVEAGRYYVSLQGSRITDHQGMKVKITLRGVPDNFHVFVDGAPVHDYARGRNGDITITTDLNPVRVEAKP